MWGSPRSSRTAERRRFVWNKIVARIGIKMLRATGTLGTSTNFTVHVVLEKLGGFQVDKRIHAFMKLEGSQFSQKDLIGS